MDELNEEKTAKEQLQNKVLETEQEYEKEIEFRKGIEESNQKLLDELNEEKTEKESIEFISSENNKNFKNILDKYNKDLEETYNLLKASEKELSLNVIELEDMNFLIKNYKYHINRMLKIILKLLNIFSSDKSYLFKIKSKINKLMN